LLHSDHDVHHHLLHDRTPHADAYDVRSQQQLLLSHDLWQHELLQHGQLCCSSIGSSRRGLWLHHRDDCSHDHLRRRSCHQLWLRFGQ
jgi:hypothetical protein